MRTLMDYDWPGNVRELVNAMERAVLLCDTNEIKLMDLPTRIVRAVNADSRTILSLAGEARSQVELPDELLLKPLTEARKQVVAAFEAKYLSSVLEATGGRIGETASRIGLSERSLYEMMKRHGLRKETFRGQLDK